VWLDRLLQPTGIVAGAALATLLLFVFVGLLFTSRAIRRSDVGAAQAWLRDVVMRSGS
jgi:hypothetical protein